MGNELEDLFSRLMGIRSVSGEETAIADCVERLLRESGRLLVRRDGDTVVASTNLGRATRVALAGHLDTVPVIDNFPPRWLEPGDPDIRSDVAEAHPGERVMWGRGAVDMKASGAVLLHLAMTLDDPRYDLSFVFYDHEEVAAELNGLRRVSERHPEWLKADFAVIGEPTSCGIEGGCNGSLRFDVITHGIAAHSARAWMGRNAIHEAAAVLDRLAAYEPADVEVDGLVYREGLNATLISGGRGTNVIPDECRVHVNYRFAPDKDVAAAKALMMGEGTGAKPGAGERAALGGVFAGFGIEMKDESPSARPGMDAPLARALAALVEEGTGRRPVAKLGWTDVARFADLGVPAVNLGAGSPLLAHRRDEQIAAGELAELESLLRRWLLF
ncbi:succinyl-diaminopimelate desuccinylase [uncultured Bifidobacterium sp.]|uniref:succinyl-diaminopimelate desuccinylase n=1 Tax=uncultured Bifidobacterium sp. TaxID=165187 RepID=UPI0028DC1210|nr:succinyl-diaminopimelate desuccinylase [uncultured Bifidobacterium sp.]